MREVVERDELRQLVDSDELALLSTQVCAACGTTVHQGDADVIFESLVRRVTAAGLTVGDLTGTLAGDTTRFVAFVAGVRDASHSDGTYGDLPGGTRPAERRASDQRNAASMAASMCAAGKTPGPVAPSPTGTTPCFIPRPAPAARRRSVPPTGRMTPVRPSSPNA